jgi:hypothetical protein
MTSIVQYIDVSQFAISGLLGSAGREHIRLTTARDGDEIAASDCLNKEIEP